MEDSATAESPAERGEILILDDDPDVLAFLVRAAGDLGHAVRGFVDPDEFLQSPALPPPACLVVDWQLRGRDGLEVIARSQRLWPAAPVIFISGHATVPVTVTAMRQGVTSVLEKPVRPADLVREIRLALEQSQTRSAAEAERLEARRKIETLNDSERSILKYVAKGTPNKNMSTQLHVATRTVEKYRRSLFDKLGVDSAAEATRLWVLANLE
jgi:FixJ family two-component response regulator